ncbi:hypothetical protein [Halomarina oriensis]|uniref:Uncharacterized protein n=1 Tax=Halomarina oriensis TaxID=671145 RepID=A0A6B0GSG4_9EURY|nr:hypothetical protein [Halomarina oriensis]MWG34618.1 hypothetical protein [Halomarina oriensis]
MGSSSLRRTKISGNGQRFERLSDTSSSDFSIETAGTRRVTPRCSDYPFGSQIVYRGSIEYEEVAEFGGGREIQLDFEFREESQLFILESDVDLPSIDSVIKRINSIIPSEVRIYRKLTVHRDRLWNFLRSADSILEVTLLGDQAEEISLAQIHSESDLRESEFGYLVEKHPIESATVVFQHEGEQTTARYTDGTLSIHSESPQAREHIIQIFERDVLFEEDA